jgi:hypothetical protein
VEDEMQTLSLTFPDVAFITGTRAALAFGAGLLLSPRLSESRRRAVGLTLVTIGVATTIPAAWRLFASRRPPRSIGQ